MSSEDTRVGIEKNQCGKHRTDDAEKTVIEKS